MHTRPISTTEAAARLGVSRETARRWAAAGRLRGEKVENRWLIEPDAVGTGSHLDLPAGAALVDEDALRRMLVSRQPTWCPSPLLPCRLWWRPSASRRPRRIAGSAWTRRSSREPRHPARRGDPGHRHLAALQWRGDVYHPGSGKGGEDWREAGLVVTDEHGAAVAPWRMSYTFRTLARQAGLRVIRLHTARHTAGTLMYEATLDLKKVQKWMGHATAAITADRYVHDRAETDAAAAGQVAAYFASM